MEKNVNLIKKSIIVLLAVALLMYIVTGHSYADDIIDLDLLETIETIDTITENTTNNNVVEIEETNTVTTNTSTNNVVKNQVITTNSSANQVVLPDTGSNAEIIFIIGTTLLAGTAIYLYNKAKIK